MRIGNFIEVASYILVILDFFIVFLIVFSGRKNPASTWAWLLVILLIPYGGVFLYLILGLDSRKHSLFQRKMREDLQIYESYLASGLESAEFSKSQRKGFDRKNLPDIMNADHLSDMVYLNMFPGKAALTSDNEVILYHEGESKFTALLKDIAAAKRFIHMQYYIVRGDALGAEIIQALARKAAEGIEVRLLIDGMGSNATPKKFYKPLLDAGGKLAVFQPPVIIRVNYRNHRKLCVIDAECGYIGGLNIGDEYVSRKKRFGFWRDTHLRVAGGAIDQLQLRFIMDWNYCSADKILLERKYFADRKFGGSAGIQVISGGPDTEWPVVHFAYNKMINEAEKSVFIQTPYFVPDDSIFESLRVAALSGLDVRIMIPANPDHPFVYWAGLSYLGDLLDSGVKCYEYTNGFIHSKVVVVDGIVASVGTANMDVRSFKLNLETNAVIFDAEVAEELEHQFLIDADYCREITRESYDSRPWLTKVRESFSRLLSPLL